VLRLLFSQLLRIIFANVAKQRRVEARTLSSSPIPSKCYFSEQSFLTLEILSLRGLNHSDYNSFLLPIQEEFFEFLKFKVNSNRFPINRCGLLLAGSVGLSSRSEEPIGRIVLAVDDCGAILRRSARQYQHCAGGDELV